ncbi:hypothetical protein BY996DRAFT_6616142 [Phakopsora pachyrhizi]|nr:hypothetical protein BY996DRAFT_6616142 [Phakopsora pachyrhizi]
MNLSLGPIRDLSFWKSYLHQGKIPPATGTGHQNNEMVDQYYNHEEYEEGGRFIGDGLTTKQKQTIDILNTCTQEYDQSNSLNKNREMRTNAITRTDKIGGSGKFVVVVGQYNLDLSIGEWGMDIAKSGMRWILDADWFIIGQYEDWNSTVNAAKGHISFFEAHGGYGSVRTPHLEDSGDGRVKTQRIQDKQDRGAENSGVRIKRTLRGEALV